MTTLMITDGGDRLSGEGLQELRTNKSKLDYISMVLTSGSDSGFAGLNDDAIRVTRKGLFMELTKLGNSML